MDKKDIYEHLAKIYLDASLKKKNGKKSYLNIFKNLFFLSIVFIVALSGSLFFVLEKRWPYKSEVALILLPEAAKINFNFDPARKEMYLLALNKLNISGYKSLGFTVKKNNYQDNTSLRVEFTNAFREQSEVYIKDIPHKWRDYKIKLSEFRGINDWSEIQTLSFTVEEWNAKDKKGLVLLDNVRLLK